MILISIYPRRLFALCQHHFSTIHQRHCVLLLQQPQYHLQVAGYSVQRQQGMEWQGSVCFVDCKMRILLSIIALMMQQRLTINNDQEVRLIVMPSNRE